MFAGVIDLTDRRSGRLPMGARLALLEADDPGPAVIAELASIDVTTVSEFDQVVLLRTWERQRTWLDAVQQPVLTAVGGPEPTEGDWGREEVAAALALSKVTASRRLDVARQLCGPLTATLDALRLAQLSYYHAAHLAQETAGLPDELARRVEALALPKALGRPGTPGQGLAAFRRNVATAIIEADPDRADRAHEDTLAERAVGMWPDGVGTATVRASSLPADKAAVVMSVLRALGVKTGAQDSRGQDQRLADAFIAVFDDAHARLDLPLQQGRRPVTSLVLDFDTWTGLASHAGQIDGYGPIPPAMARRIAEDSDLRRLLYDPTTGHLLDATPRTYKPSQALTDYIIDRHRVCDAPHCNRPARTCDLDHAIPFSHGGTTTRGNLAPECGRDHPARHDGGWALHREPDGSATWTSPRGHPYPTQPWDYRPLE